MMIELRPAIEGDLRVLLTWFDSESDVRNWGGPLMRFPVVLEQLKNDIHWGITSSHSLVEGTELLGFAQITIRHGRDHIRRVVVHPRRRGQGLGRRLLELILASAITSGEYVSLFVSQDNSSAKRLYGTLGFQVHPAPDEQDTCGSALFMVKRRSSRSVTGLRSGESCR